MPTVSLIEFTRNFAQKAGLPLKEAKPLVKMIEDEITKALVGGHPVRLTGLGILSKARFRSQTMFDPNNRRRKLLVLDRYFVRLKASQTLKNQLKALYFPDSTKYQKFTRSKTGESLPEDKAVPINAKGTPIKVNIRPHIPALSWRQSPSGLFLNLDRRPAASSGRLVRNLIQSIASQPHSGVSITPTHLTFHGATTTSDNIDPKIYRLIIDFFQRNLAPAFSHPQTWRLLVSLPQKHTFNLLAAPAGDDEWLIRLKKPRATYLDHHKLNINLPPTLAQKLDSLLKQRSSVRIAVCGTPRHRLALTNFIRRRLEDKQKPYALVVEHHHHLPHSHHTIEPSLHTTLQGLKKQPAIILENLSAADNLHALGSVPGTVVAGLSLPHQKALARTLENHNLPANFFDLVFEYIAVPLVCPECENPTSPAVRYPTLRKIAARRRDRLSDYDTVIPSSSQCSHPLLYEDLVAGYDPDGVINPSLADQLYRLALARKISLNTLEDLI